MLIHHPLLCFHDAKPVFQAAHFFAAFHCVDGVLLVVSRLGKGPIIATATVDRHRFTEGERIREVLYRRRKSVTAPPPPLLLPLLCHSAATARRLGGRSLLRRGWRWWTWLRGSRSDIAVLSSLNIRTSTGLVPATGRSLRSTTRRIYMAAPARGNRGLPRNRSSTPDTRRRRRRVTEKKISEVPLECNAASGLRR